VTVFQESLRTQLSRHLKTTGDNLRELAIWPGSIEVHCEKSLFVLASSQKIPENPAVDTRTICLPPHRVFFKFPMPEMLLPENPNCRYGRKIWLPVTADTAGKSWQITTDTAGNPAASNYRNGRKIPAINTMNAIASYPQGCNGAMVEYLFHYLKVEGSRSACAQQFFSYTTGKFR
jgi:hypothetical protein